MVEATENAVVTVQSIDGNIAEKDDPKPRTVLFQGGEDDTTVRNLSMMVATDKSKSIHMDEYPTNVVQDEAMIVVDKFKHAKETQELMMHVREEKYVQVERPIIIWLDVPEIGGNQGNRYSDYFGKSRFLGGSKESKNRFNLAMEFIVRWVPQVK